MEDASIALTQAQNQYEVGAKTVRSEGRRRQLTSAKGKTAGAEAQLSYTKIVSPINGVVTDRPVLSGRDGPQRLSHSTVMDLSQVVARAHISQQEAAQLKVGDAATISVPGATAAFRARSRLVSPALDPNSTTVEVWVQAPNPGSSLKPGASVRVTMVAETVPHAIVIPAPRC